MIVARLISELKLVVQKLGVVHAESAVLAPHSYNFINHVKTVLGYFLSDVLIGDNFADVFKAALGDIKKRLWWAATQTLMLLLGELLLNEVVRLHNPVVILLHDVMPLCVSRLRPSFCLAAGTRRNRRVALTLVGV